MNSDLLAKVGPLAALCGVWKGDKGLDIAPEPEGVEQSPFYETLTITPVGDVTNAEEQTLLVVNYQQVVQRKSNGEVFHHESGYYLYDQATQEITQTFSIPRAVSVVASGILVSNGDHTSFEVLAEQSKIAQSDFMQEKAKTISFEHKVRIENNSLKYEETTIVEIYGRKFEHTDRNELTKE